MMFSLFILFKTRVSLKLSDEVLKIDNIDCDTYEVEDNFFNNTDKIVKVYDVCVAGKIHQVEDAIITKEYQTANIKFPDFFFENAQFQIYPSGGSGDYRYSTGDYSDYIQVDDKGVVTMLKEYDLDTFDTGPYITITDEVTKHVEHYKLEVGNALNGVKYFISIDTSRKVTFDEAIKYCHTMSEDNAKLYSIPHTKMIHNGVDSSDGSEVRMRGELFGEYGDLTLYYPEVKDEDEFVVWTHLPSRLLNNKRFGVPIDLTNGSFVQSHPTHAYPMCMTLTFVHQIENIDEIITDTTATTKPINTTTKSMPSTTTSETTTTTTSVPYHTTSESGSSISALTVAVSVVGAIGAVGASVAGAAFLYDFNKVPQNPSPSVANDVDLEHHYDEREVQIPLDHNDCFI